jgi:hypothetical protein
VAGGNAIRNRARHPPPERSHCLVSPAGEQSAYAHAPAWPGRPHDSFVEGLWYYQRPARGQRRELALPTGAVDIIFNLAGEDCRIVDDVDELMRRAVEAGATIVRELENDAHGERAGLIRDPFGHEWHLGQQIEEVSAGEMQRRHSAMFS